MEFNLLMPRTHESILRRFSFMMFHNWQDAVVSLSNVFFSVTIILMLVNPNTQVPRHSSIPTATALAAMTVAFATLYLIWSATICGLNALLWFAIAIWRPTRS